ncbi:MAG TPA: alpha/beta fold hydrolase [Oceanospirillales bacterium]|nr:alpha/beta fold hydrolase [Oceanospirillales bacterium]
MNKVNLTTDLGYPIAVNEFLPANKPKACVLIASATGVKQTLYCKFSQFLAEQGYAVYTFDYGGIGESKTTSLKAFDTSASNWSNNDLEAVIQHSKKRHGDMKLMLIGHSIGGQLIGINPSAKNVDGILLVAAQTGYWPLWKGSEKIKMFLVWYFLMPTLTRLFGYFPGKSIGSSEDLPKAMALEWRKWCVSPNYLFDHNPHASDLYNAIKCPIHSFSAEDDNFAPKVTVDWLTEKYNNADKVRIHLVPKEIGADKIGHFGYFRSKNKGIIWNLLLKHLDQLL